MFSFFLVHACLFVMWSKQLIVLSPFLSLQSGTTSHTAPQYSVTEVLGDEMAVFRIHPSLGNLSVSGVFNDERYLVVVTVFNGDATSSAVIEVTINFKPVFTTTSFRTTVTVSNVAVGDSIGAVSCTDQNSQDTSNGILTLRLHLNASASSYFSIAENGTVFVSGDLNRLRALQSTVNGYIICADNGQPERLSSTIKVSIALQGMLFAYSMPIALPSNGSPNTARVHGTHTTIYCRAQTCLKQLCSCAICMWISIESFNASHGLYHVAHHCYTNLVQASCTLYQE